MIARAPKTAGHQTPTAAPTTPRPEPPSGSSATSTTTSHTAGGGGGGGANGPGTAQRAKTRSAPQRPEALVTSLDSVSPVPVRWLWRNRIPLGKLTLLAGDPGVGKSFLTMELAARVSQGRQFPDERAIPGAGAIRQPGQVVLLTAEDDLADTVRPRLDGAGADSSKIVAIRGVRYHSAESPVVDIVRDLPLIEDTVSHMKSCKLIIVDPISAYMGGTDSNNNAEVRKALAPLSEMAGRLGVAVVAVTHLRKGEGKAVYRSMGSLAFAAAARSVWLVTKDPDDRERRLLLGVKQNVGSPSSGLAYRIVDGAIVWEDSALDMDADELEERSSSAHAAPFEERVLAAMQWMRKTLTGRIIPVKGVQKQAAEAGISRRAFEEARSRLGVRSWKHTDSVGMSRFVMGIREGEGK